MNNLKEKDLKGLYFFYGVPDVIRTHDRTLRRRMLYPAELSGQQAFVN